MAVCFNTASGRCCCNTRKSSRLRDPWVSIPQAVGAVATLQNHDNYHENDFVSIPQAVGAVATFSRSRNYRNTRNVSIPQAVGAVATWLSSTSTLMPPSICFNTASGRCCCNEKLVKCVECSYWVSIPQAVGAVATLYRCWKRDVTWRRVSIPQAVGAVATAGSRKPVFMRFQKLVLENLKP